MARPKSADPKVAVTLRVPQSVLSAYQAKGNDWRETMVVALSGDIGIPMSGAPSPAKVPAPARPAAPAPEPVKAAPGYALQIGPVQSPAGSRLKTGKR